MWLWCLIVTPGSKHNKLCVMFNNIKQLIECFIIIYIINIEFSSNINANYFTVMH